MGGSHEDGLRQEILPWAASASTFFCGPESFTPDLNPIIGPAPEVPNYWVAAGLNSIGILTGGGLGRLVAHWIVAGAPGADVTAIHPDRLHPYQANPEYRRTRTVSSQGNRGQISYASTKAGLEGAAATIMKEAMYYGVRCSVIHPGFTDTPMVRAMGADYVAKNILPYTQLGRLIQPTEIADAICFMLANSAVSGELWVDAGWHAPA